MKTLKPRSFAHRGHVRATGFIIPSATVGLLAVRRRVLSVWQSGAQVRRLDGAYLLLLPRAVHVDCSCAPGEPMVRIDRMLAALPLDSAEIEALRLPVDCVVTARSGEFVVTDLASLPLEDVAGWFSLGEMKMVKVQSLGDPPATPIFAMPVFDPRSAMKAPGGSSELQDFLQALQAQKSGRLIPQAEEPWHRRMAGFFANGAMVLGAGFRGLLQKPLSWFKGKQKEGAVSAGTGVPAPAVGGAGVASPGARLAVGLALIAAVAGLALIPGMSVLPLLIGAGMGLRQLFSGAQAAKTSGAARGATGTPRAAAPPKPPSWLSLKVNHALARMFMLTRLSRLMGARYARHIARVMHMMEHGDLDEALRNAIPLNDMPNVSSGRIAFFSLFTARQNLSITPYKAPVSSSVGVGNDFFQYMRALYRQTFQRLEAQGRLDEAAFVLSELLSANAEAVSFLEKHGHLRLAAELAEARNLPAPTVVRLWFLAGDAKRAIAVARRTGSFQTAIALMARTHPEEAKTLRVAWATKLAEAGKYFAAATTIWEVETGRNLAARWFDQAVELGGNTGAAALAKRIARFPDTFPANLPRVTALLDDERQECALERLAFVEALLPEHSTLESRTLTRAATRSIVRDIQQGYIERTPAQLRQLVDHSGDGGLRADVPAVSRLVPAESVSPEPIVLEIPRHDVGRSNIYDCALLPDGKLLLAMGEAGVVLCSREGKAFFTFNQPVYKLVLSDEGSRAIGIAQRGEAYRLCRLDLVTRSSDYWCDTHITKICSGFDGSLWYVAEKNDVYVVDTLAPRFDALWRLPEMGRRVLALQRSDAGDRLNIVSLGDDNRLTHWSYALPGHTLRSKQELAIATECETVDRSLAITGDGIVYERLGVFRFDNETDTSHLQTEMYRYSGNQVERAAVEIYGADMSKAASLGNWIAAPVFEKEAIAVTILDSRANIGQRRIGLAGAQNVSLRFVGDVLLCCDDLGRVIALDLARNKVVRNQRF